MSSTEIEYQGETKTRKLWLAALLTALAPGLGYVYIGELVRGITINILFIVAIEIFIIAFSLLHFFPLVPLLVFGAAWATFVVLFVLDIRARLDRSSNDYVLKTYNHWITYTITFVLTFLAPVFVTTHLVSTHLIAFHDVTDSAMFPSLRTGDTVLVDQSAFRGRSPDRGELVALESDRGHMLTLRVVAKEGDVVRVEGETIFVNEEPLTHANLDPEPAELGEFSNMLAMVEDNGGSRYVISVAPRAFSAIEIPPTEIPEDQYFVLADNRSQVPVGKTRRAIRDSRNFGPVSTTRLVGKPLYIAWSRSTQGVRVERIGLKLN